MGAEATQEPELKKGYDLVNFSERREKLDKENW